MPGQAIARRGLDPVVHHLGPEHPQHPTVELAAERPPPTSEGLLTRARLEGRRPAGRAAVEEREAVAGLHHRGVVGEAAAVQVGGQPGMVDEGVLEQPQPPVRAEGVDVLVVPSQHRPHPLAEHRLQPGRVPRVGAADIGRHVAGGRGVGAGRPRWWWGRRWRGRWSAGRDEAHDHQARRRGGASFRRPSAHSVRVILPVAPGRPQGRRSIRPPPAASMMAPSAPPGHGSRVRGP